MADRYWVGGASNWDGTAGTKWATTSGGAGGASVPTTSDDVFFDANSGAVTCTIATGNTGAKSINCTGFTGTLTGTANITVSGSITLVAGMTYTHTGTVTINGTGTLTTAGKTFSGLTINGSGITVTLGDALNIGANTLTVAQGIFTTSANNYNVSAGGLLSISGSTRTITLNSSNVTLTSITAINLSTTNLTFNANTSQINLTSGTADITSSGQTFYNVAFTNNTAGTRTITGANTFNNLSVTAPASAGVTQVTFNSNQTINGTLSTTGTAGNRRVWFRSDTYGVRRTLTVNSAPSLTDADFRDIIVNGTAAPISGTRIGNRGACAGITFDAPKTVYWNLAAGGNWSANAWAATSGGTVSTDNFPLPQDTAVIENTGLNNAASVTLDTAIGYISTVDMSSRTVFMSFSIANPTIVYGSLKLFSNLNISGGGGNTFTFSGEGTKTITSAGRTFINSFTIDAYGGTVELADALNIGTNTLTVTNGTFDTKNYNVTAGSLSSNNSNVRTIKLGSSTVNFSASLAISLDSTNLTFDAGTSQLNFSGGNSDIGVTGGVTFYNLSFASTVSFPTISGTNTYNNFTFAGPASAGIATIAFSNNQTINGTLTISGGSAIRRIFVRSNTIGTTRTITANAISANDCDFRDITIAGSAAGASPTRAGDCGGNSGINFPAPKTVYWNLAGVQNWSATAWATSSGGTPDVNNFPLAQDTAVVDDVGAASTISVNASWNIGTFNSSARTSIVTFSIGSATTFYGDFLFGSGVSTSTGPSVVTFAKRGTQTITSNGRTFGHAITIDSFSGTFQLGDALTIDSARALTLTSGTFDAVSYNVTTGLFNASATKTRTLNMGSGLWTLSGTGTVWGLGTTTNLTFLKGTADILLSDTSTTARTFSGGGLSYNKLTIGGATGTSTTTITQNNQFTELASTKTVAHTIALGTTTQTFGKWTVTGTAGNVVTLTGTGTSHILAGSATSGIDYLAMGSIGFSGFSPAEFYAGANSTGTAGAPVFRTAPPTPRTLYWVGGGGNWSNTAKWSLSSGGAGGQAEPTSLDNVIFDSASNATAYTANIAGSARCNQLTIAGPASGNLTISGTSPLFVHGNTTIAATGVVMSFSDAITLSGSTTGKTFTTNGVALSNNITVNGVGCGWTLGGALNISSQQVTITNGSFDTGNFNLTCGTFTTSTRNTRTISFGSSTVSVSNSFGLNDLNNPDLSNTLTFNAGTSQINLTNSSPSFGADIRTFHNVSFTSTSAGTRTMFGANNTFNNLTLNASATSLTQLSINANQTITGTLTCSGSSAVARGFVRSNTIGTTRTLTVGTLAANDCDFRDITIAGTAAGTAPTRAGNCGGNSGITFPAPKTVYRVGTGAAWNDVNSWATISGGTGDTNNFPLAQDTAVIDNNTALTGSLNNRAYNVGTLDSSNRTTGITLNYGQTDTFYGNYTLGSGVTVSSTATQIFSGRGTMTFTSAGKTIPFPITVDTPTGTFQLGDAITATADPSPRVTRGTFSAGIYNVTLTSFDSSNANIRTINMGSGLWTLTSSNIPWDFGTSTNLTFNKDTANILLTDTSTLGRTFRGGDRSYNKLTIGGTTGVSTLTLTGNNTFTEIASTKTVAHTIALGTTTQRVGAFTVTGTVGNVVTITGTTSNLIYTGSGTVGSGVDYLNVQGRVYGPTGQTSGIWYAGANSTNSGSLGWEFTSGSTVLTASITEAYTSASAQDTAANIFNSTLTENSILADVQVPTGVFGVTITENSNLADSQEPSFTLFVSVTEPTTLANFQEFVNLITADIVENLTSAEAQSTTSAFNSAITENLTLAEAAAAAGVFSVILVENTNVADTATVQAAFSTLISEGFTPADIQTASNVITRSLTEGQSVADVQNGVRALAASITENLVSEEAESALKVLVSSIAENLSSAEAQTTQVNFNADRVEPVTSADIAAAQANFNSAVAEASTLADILDAIRVLADTVTENSNPADTQNRTAIFARTAIESLASQAQEAARADFNSNTLENMVLSDQLVGYGWFRIVDNQTAVWTNVNNTQSITWTNVGNDQNPNWVQINDKQP